MASSWELPAREKCPRGKKSWLSPFADKAMFALFEKEILLVI